MVVERTVAIFQSGVEMGWREIPSRYQEASDREEASRGDYAGYESTMRWRGNHNRDPRGGKRVAVVSSAGSKIDWMGGLVEVIRSV
jgi:hypothetical protein